MARRTGETTMADIKSKVLISHSQLYAMWTGLAICLLGIGRTQCQDLVYDNSQPITSGGALQADSSTETTDSSEAIVFTYDRLIAFQANEDDLNILARAPHVMFLPGIPEGDKYEVSCRQITDDLVRKVIKHTPQLKILRLYRTAITNDVLEDIGKLEHLEVLDLTDTEISNQGLRHLKTLPRLRKLDLTYCPINSRGLRHLQDMPSLESLVLDYTYTEDDGLEYLTSLEKLRHLSLYRTYVGDDGVECLRSLAGLRSLSLQCTRISVSGVYTLEDFSMLEFVNLGGNDITKESVEGLARALPKLEIRVTNFGAGN